MITKLENLVFRAWSYFRTGYGTYLAFPMGFISFISTTYYLTINNIPSLASTFPNLYGYAIMVMLIVPPLGALIGWVHMKKSLAYSSQLYVSAESSPYSYRMRPGVETELGWPMWMLLWGIIEKTSESMGVLSDDDREDIEEVRKKILTLLQGGSIGMPTDLRMTTAAKQKKQK